MAPAPSTSGATSVEVTGAFFPPGSVVFGTGSRNDDLQGFGRARLHPDPGLTDDNGSAQGDQLGDLPLQRRGRPVSREIGSRPVPDLRRHTRALLGTPS